MNRGSLAAIAVLGISFLAEPTFAQQTITCDVIAASSGLSTAEQRALGAAAAARVAELRNSDPAEADRLQACIADAATEVVAGYQGATPAVGDVEFIIDQHEHTQGDEGRGSSAPASHS